MDTPFLNCLRCGHGWVTVEMVMGRINENPFLKSLVNEGKIEISFRYVTLRNVIIAYIKPVTHDFISGVTIGDLIPLILDLGKYGKLNMYLTSEENKPCIEIWLSGDVCEE